AVQQQELAGEDVGKGVGDLGYFGTADDQGGEPVVQVGRPAPCQVVRLAGQPGGGRLLEQVGVVDRQGREVGQRGQQCRFLVGEAAFVPVAGVEHAEYFAPGDQRGADDRGQPLVGQCGVQLAVVIERVVAGIVLDPLGGAEPLDAGRHATAGWHLDV